MFQRVLISTFFKIVGERDTIQWCQIENTCLYMCGHTMGMQGGSKVSRK